jgi:hypothetical protein
VCDKLKTMTLVLIVSPLRMQHWGLRARTGWLRIRIMWVGSTHHDLLYWRQYTTDLSHTGLMIYYTGGNIPQICHTQVSWSIILEVIYHRCVTHRSHDLLYWRQYTTDVSHTGLMIYPVCDTSVVYCLQYNRSWDLCVTHLWYIASSIIDHETCVWHICGILYHRCVTHRSHDLLYWR